MAYRFHGRRSISCICLKHSMFSSARLRAAFCQHFGQGLAAEGSVLRDRRGTLETASTNCFPCHAKTTPRCGRCACHTKRGPQPRARQHRALWTATKCRPCHANVNPTQPSPKCCVCAATRGPHADAGNAALATKSASYAASATQNGALSRPLDNIEPLQTAT